MRQFKEFRCHHYHCHGFMGPILFIVAIAGFTLVTMLLWNALMPVLFGAPALGFFQALGLLILSRILFGGLSGFRGMAVRHFDRHGTMMENWMNMNPEERQKFRDRLSSRHCHGGRPHRHETDHHPLQHAAADARPGPTADNSAGTKDEA